MESHKKQNIPENTSGFDSNAIQVVIVHNQHLTFKLNQIKLEFVGNVRQNIAIILDFK